MIETNKIELNGKFKANADNSTQQGNSGFGIRNQNQRNDRERTGDANIEEKIEHSKIRWKSINDIRRDIKTVSGIRVNSEAEAKFQEVYLKGTSNNLL